MRRPAKRIPLLSWALLAILLAAVGAPSQVKPTPRLQIDDVLRRGVEQKGLPGIVAMVAQGQAIVYQGAFGKYRADSIFRIASMTKPVTSVAVMQLVERGRVKLDEPASTYLPELAKVQVLEGFDESGKARLRPPKSAVTVRQLLTHTSGFAYEFFDEKLARYVTAGGASSVMTGDDRFLQSALMFDPGSQWEYGINTDWLGRLVEKVSGQSLEDYFRQNIFAPLGMNDSFFNVPPGKQARVVPVQSRKDDGTLAENPPQPWKPVAFMSGGGGLYSTAADFLKFTQMLVGGGTLGKARILKPETVAAMGRNQIGELSLTEFQSLSPQLARNGVRLPGELDKFGFGFATNTRAVQGGRAAGSLAWAGIYNTFFWIDPARKTSAVLMTQLLPFLDEAARTTLEEFESAVYAPAAAGNQDRKNEE